MGINAIFKHAGEAFEKAAKGVVTEATQNIRHGRFVSSVQLDAKLRKEIAEAIAKNKDEYVKSGQITFYEKKVENNVETYVKHVVDFIKKKEAEKYTKFTAFLDNTFGAIKRFLGFNRKLEIDLTTLKGGQLIRNTDGVIELAKGNFIKNSNSAFSNIMKHDPAKIKEDLGTLDNNGVIERIKATGKGSVADTVNNKWESIDPANYIIKGEHLAGIKKESIKIGDFADPLDQKYHAVLEQLISAEGLGAKRIVLEGLDQPTYINTFKKQLQDVNPRMKDNKKIEEALMNAHTIDELHGMIDPADRVKFELAFNKALVTDFLNKDPKNAEKLFTFTAASTTPKP